MVSMKALEAVSGDQRSFIFVFLGMFLFLLIILKLEILVLYKHREREREREGGDKCCQFSAQQRDEERDKFISFLFFHFWKLKRIEFSSLVSRKLNVYLDSVGVAVDAVNCIFRSSIQFFFILNFRFYSLTFLLHSMILVSLIF